MTGFLATIAEPLAYDFMWRAMGVGVFISVLCAVLSCFIVLKGWALVGDALSHAVLPGIVVAYVAGLPLVLGAAASGLACVWLAGAANGRTRVKPDALLGISFTGFLAVGLILMVATPSEIHFMHVLFGNLLGIETAAILQVLAVGVPTLAIVLAWRKDLVLAAFDPAQARVIGLSPVRLELLLLALTAFTVVVAMQAVGIALVMAMLVTPGCIGRLLADRFDRMLIAAASSAAFATALGTLASFWADGATGATIVLVQATLFVLAFLFAPRRGLLARHRAVARAGS
ncbi:metal ABC transporter permease [Methylobrevis albus]|nr:metal ABC transporter permease [Methylobrevis albus]